jgi:UDP-N-acetylmuramate dehydrogenase
MGEVSERRRETQPWGQATAGSVFKNPQGHSAGRLIDECGLKGASVGGARISQVHANFIVNQSGASAADIKALIDLAAKEVKERFGVVLEIEVKLIGFEAR